MFVRRWMLLLLLMPAACQVETHDVKPEQVVVYVPEERFATVTKGMSAAEVAEVVGAPRRKEGATNDTWVYGIWRGESPSFLRMIFSARAPKATVLEGRIEFSAGRVISVKVIESSAVPLNAPETSTRTK